MKKGYVNIVLHAHLPYIRHLDDETVFEEEWFYEAMCESYMPLVRMLFKARDEKLKYHITLVLSPTLVEMIKDRANCKGFVEYLDKHIELGEKELKRLEGNDEFYRVAEDTLNLYKAARNEVVNKYGEKLINALIGLQESGYVEIITSVAAHTFLPIYESRPSLVKAEIATANSVHFTTFKDYSKGLWLPDCGYYPRLDEILKKNAIESQYFFVSPVSFALAKNNIKRGVYAPVKTTSGMYVFAFETSLMNLVTSSIDGYPGDDDYREFYRDIGYDLPLSYIGEYVPDAEKRGFTGYKYYSVSGKKEDKKVYNKDKAMAKVDMHSSHFVDSIQARVKEVGSLIDQDPVINLAFDAELLGHWWKEGIDWLYSVIKKINANDNLSLITSSDYIKIYPDAEKASLARSALTLNTYASPYLDGSNNKIQRVIFNAIDKVEDITARYYNDKNPVRLRYIKQAVKEMLLATSSDWLQIMHNNTSPIYAERKIEEHLQSINKIYDLLSYGKGDTSWLVRQEKKYPLFDAIDYHTFTNK